MENCVAEYVVDRYALQFRRLRNVHAERGQRFASPFVSVHGVRVGVVCAKYCDLNAWTVWCRWSIASGDGVADLERCSYVDKLAEDALTPIYTGDRVQAVWLMDTLHEGDVQLSSIGVPQDSGGDVSGLSAEHHGSLDHRDPGVLRHQDGQFPFLL